MEFQEPLLLFTGIPALAAMFGVMVAYAAARERGIELAVEAVVNDLKKRSINTKEHAQIAQVAGQTFKLSRTAGNQHAARRKVFRF